MANGNLIQGARRIGQARRFVDYGKIIGDNIKSPALTKYIEDARAQYFQNIKEKEAKLASFINQKQYMDMSKINEYNVDMASDFLSKKKAEYLEAANIAATASVGSEQYVNAVSTMNAANNAIKNFDVELQAWRKLNDEQDLDFDKNAISKGNLNYGDIMETMQDPNSENGPSFIVNDNGKVTMAIRDAEGNIIKELERQEYFLKVTDNEFYKLGEIGDKYYNIGLNGLGLDEKRARQDVRRWMGEDHTKLLSLARDDFDEMPAFIKDEDLEKVIYNGLTGRELLQKNNQTELKSFLVDKYIGALRDRHTAGTGDFNTIKAREDDKKNNQQAAILSDINTIIKNSIVTVSAPPPIGFTSWDEFRQKNPNQPIPSDVTEGENVEKTNKNIVRNIANEYNTALSAYPFTNIIDKDEAFENYHDNAQEKPELYGLSEDDKLAFSKNTEKGREIARRLFEEQFGDAVMFSITKEGTITAFTGDIRDDEQIAKFLSNKRIITGKSIKTTEALTPSAELD